MTILSNAHTHTTFCDGKDTPEQIILQALRLGFVSLGFSAHSPLPYINDFALPSWKVDEYKAYINALKEQYEGKIEILTGLELDADSDMDTDGFDYIIGSVHQLRKGDQVYDLDSTANELALCRDKMFGGDMVKLSAAYFDTLARHCSDKRVNIVGHFDLITKFNDTDHLVDTTHALYRLYAKSAIDVILANNPDVIFEVNTGAIARGKRQLPYPDAYLLKYLADRGARIMINSDAHSAANLNACFDEAVYYCANAGVKRICRLRKGGIEELPISI